MNLDNWSSPKFRKLADLYAGRENDAYDGCKALSAQKPN